MRAQGPHDTTRTVLVTGGTRGIGAAIATAFAARNCHVLAAGLPPFDPAGHSTIEQVELDVRTPESIEALVNGLDRLDVLVNAAGVIARDREHEPEVFAEVVDVNLNGMQRVCAACRALLAESESACVVNIASMLSFFGGAHAPAYSASKGGVVQLTKSLAAAWAVDGIRVNAVAPGWIRTEMTEPLRAEQSRDRELMSRTPMGRWGEPEEVAAPVLFLASEAASFVTGAVLPVDGGYLVN